MVGFSIYTSRGGPARGADSGFLDTFEADSGPTTEARLTDSLQLYQHLGIALAVGLLIGSERYKHRNPDEPGSAGVRTFTVVALLGALAAVIGEVPLTLVSFASLAGFLALGYAREKTESLGLTTEITALLVFWLGYLAGEHPVPVLSCAVAVVVVLASKRALHDFVRMKVTDIEFFDTLKFLVVVMVVMPLLPSQPMGPYGFFNPAQAWGLVILVSSISYFGYLAVRLWGNKRGLILSSLIGGVVSSTAVTVSLAARAKASPAGASALGVAGVLANAVQMPRVLLLVAFVSADLLRVLAFPLGAMFGAGFVGLGLMWLVNRRGDDSPAPEVVHTNPYAFVPALKFAGLFLLVLLGSRFAEAHFGAEGVLVTSALAGLIDVSAVALSVAGQVAGGTLGTDPATVAILAALTTNAAVKLGLAAAQGNRTFLGWLTGGFVLMYGLGAVFALQRLL